MSATTEFSVSPAVPAEAPLKRLARALCSACALFADLPRRSRDRALLRAFDHQMLADVGQHRVSAELAKPIWRT